MTKMVSGLVIFIGLFAQDSWAGAYTKSCRQEVMTWDFNRIAKEYHSEELNHLPSDPGFQFRNPTFKDRGSLTGLKYDIYAVPSIVSGKKGVIQNAELILFVVKSKDPETLKVHCELMTTNMITNI